MVSRTIAVGILTTIALLTTPLSASAKTQQVPLHQRVQEDHAYRNRYYAGWAFFWLIVTVGLYALLMPHEKAPQPRQG